MEDLSLARDREPLTAAHRPAGNAPSYCPLSAPRLENEQRRSYRIPVKRPVTGWVLTAIAIVGFAGWPMPAGLAQSSPRPNAPYPAPPKRSPIIDLADSRTTDRAGRQIN
jgi:hypothetical protein